MALTHAEPRLAPLGSTFLAWGERPGARKRSHSYSGYIPHHLQLSPDDLDDRRGSGSAFPTGATAAPPDDDSDGLHTGFTSELWPDTDSEDEEYVWSPFSRWHTAAASPAGPKCAPPRARQDDGGAARSTAAAAPQGAVRVPAAAGRGGPARPRARSPPQAPTPLPRGITSLMLRGLPQEVGQRDLLQDVRRAGYAGRVDFLYLPRDFASGRSQGHAFLNFVSHEAAAKFRLAWHGRPTCAGRAVGAPGIDISVAALQGLAANAGKWDKPRMRRVRNRDHRPFVLNHGAAPVPAGLP